VKVLYESVVLFDCELSSNADFKLWFYLKSINILEIWDSCNFPDLLSHIIVVEQGP
jgi:hypothetical protein